MQKFNVKEQFFSRKYIYRFILFLVLLGSFVFSLVLYLVNKNGARKIFIFPSVSGEYVVEYRNLAKNPLEYEADSSLSSVKVREERKNENKLYEIRHFIDELLLGSQLERTKMIFTPGTKINSCFVRNDLLYLDLTSDLLKMGDNVISIKEGFGLLEKNIEKNFPEIKDIVFFVDGKFAFD